MVYRFLLLNLTVLLLLPTAPRAKTYKLGDEMGQITTSPKKPARKPAANEKTGQTSKNQDELLMADVANEFYEKGVVALKKGRLKEARLLFERALTLAPDHAKAQEGIDLVNSTNEKAASPSTQETSLTKRKLVDKLKIDLEQSLKEEKWEMAESQAQKILAVDPSNKFAQSNLKKINTTRSRIQIEAAKNYIEKEEYSKALTIYQEANEMHPSSASKAKIQWLQNRINEKNKKFSQEYYLEALQASQSGQFEAAYQNCKKALKLDPDNLQARRMMERLGHR